LPVQSAADEHSGDEHEPSGLAVVIKHTCSAVQNSQAAFTQSLSILQTVPREHSVSNTHDDEVAASSLQPASSTKRRLVTTAKLEIIRFENIYNLHVARTRNHYTYLQPSEYYRQANIDIQAEG